MDIKELESFKLSDAIKFHSKLNPKLWNGTKLRPEVKQQLEAIADDFLQEMGIHELDVRDITISGSNAAYSYTDHSDLDLHILVNINDLPSSDVYKELFQAKKTIYNDTHNITIHKVPVELYVQDASEPVVSLGEYSIKNDSWIKIPTRRRSNFDQNATKAKYEKLLDIVERAIKSNNLSKIQKVLKKIKQYRQAGLDKGGEFGPENLAYKALRSRGYITKLYDLRDKLHSEKLTIETMYQPINDDYDPNGPPPGPEFKPTMPAGTVKVDVSDTYDWYKLGQHISNLKGLGKHDFGAGPPSTIMAFGDEDTEHKYIKDLEKTGLTTTDIDPVDPKQPKGMKRQKVDPTYNVNEAVNDNYLYHATQPGGIMRILRTGVIKASDRPQAATKSRTQYPTVSTTRSKQYAESEDFVDFLNLTKEGNSVIIVFDRNAVANHYKMFGTSQGTQTVGDEFEEVIVVPKGAMPIQGTMKGFYFNPRRTKELEAFKEFPWFKELFNSPYYMGTKQGMAEDDTMQYAASKTAAINPYGGLKDRQYRGAISETFDKPYPIKWEKSEFGDYDALATLPDGNPLTIMFNHESPEEVVITFWRNNSLEVTGEGDAQRVFATVLYAIQEFLKIEQPATISFSASKEVEPGQNMMSRSKLYDKLVKRYAQQWGYDAQSIDHEEGVVYNLRRKQNVSEASGYIPSEKEKNDPRFKTALTVDVKPDSIKKNAKAFSWLTDRAGIPPTLKASGKF